MTNLRTCHIVAQAKSKKINMKNKSLANNWRLILLLALLSLSACQAAAPSLIESTPTNVDQGVTTTGPFNTATSPITVMPSKPVPFAYENYRQFTAIRTWNVEGDVIRVTGIAVSAVSRRVALLTLRYRNDYHLELRDLDGKFLWDQPVSDKAAYPALAFSPDGSMIVTGTDNGSVKLWNVSDGSLVRLLGKHAYAVRVIVFSPDGTIEHLGQATIRWAYGVFRLASRCPHVSTGTPRTRENANPRTRPTFGT